MKQLSVLIIMALVSFQSISQSYQTPDSTWIANRDLKKAALLIEQGKQTYDELLLQRKQNNLLQQRIDMKDSSISQCNAQLITYVKIIDNYKLIGESYNTEVTKQKESIKILERNFRRQKTKTWIVAIMGSLVVGYLSFR